MVEVFQGEMIELREYPNIKIQQTDNYQVTALKSLERVSFYDILESHGTEIQIES